MSSNVVISKDSTSVTIHTLSVIDNTVNPIESFDIPKVPEDYDEGAEKYFFDFLYRTRNIEVAGIIAKAGAVEATTLRTNLLTIMNAGGQVSISYLGETISGTMTGLEFRELASDSGHTTPQFFMVRFSITKADPLLGN